MKEVAREVWRPHISLLTGAVALLISLLPAASNAQGTVQGTLTRADDGTPIRGVIVTVGGTRVRAVSDQRGQYTLSNVPAGQQSIVMQWVGYRPHEVEVNVTAGGTHTVDAALEAEPIQLSEIVVEGASRTPERLVEAPAAVGVVDIPRARSLSVTGQAPRAVAALPGADVVQSGMNDYNVNTRGFNSSLNRRILVLQDGRDLAIAFLGAQEWNALSLPLEDMGRIELVRGPGSALYGANAFSGVLSITTPPAREVAGTKFTLAGGELSTMRGDLRHAGVTPDGRIGYRVNAGYYRSDSWSRSRTNVGDLEAEYAEATEDPVNTPPPGFELAPLSGQTNAATPGAATGDPDHLQNIYGSARFDYYAPDGSVVTAEGGAAQVENEVFVTGIGRVQVAKAIRPWARVAWAASNFSVMGWYSGRKSIDPQVSLLSGLDLEEKSTILHGEAQYNRTFLDGMARIVVGASIRTYQVDTELTLMEAPNDDRNDLFYSGYGQVEFEVTPQLRVVGAARYDNGDLYDGQFSPKGAIVFSPTPEHSVRFTVNRAFQVPNYSEFFLRVPLSAPADFSLLEAGLRASPLGPVLAGVPDGELFTNSSAVPILALGYDDLDVEHVTSLELGYKGLIDDRLFVTVDGYFSRLTDFVTDLVPGPIPGINTFMPWTAPEAVPEAFRETVEQAVQDQLVAAGQTLAAAALTRRDDGSTAIALSYGNAGKVDEYGVELGIGVQATDEIQINGAYTFFEFDVKEQLQQDVLLPNTPKHKGNLSVTYRGTQGVDASVMAKFVDSYEWAAGVFAGNIPSSQTIDLSAGYQITPNFRVHVLATNVLDQERFHLYGGSVVGRRVLGGVTATF
ncbi:MAG: TonB-dependent receptor [Gemmatimonadota bacterium]|nr:MAG: TonB-dependent receptor [Gemmatimonadota bacterium]